MFIFGHTPATFDYFQIRTASDEVQLPNFKPSEELVMIDDAFVGGGQANYQMAFAHASHSTVSTIESLDSLLRINPGD